MNPLAILRASATLPLVLLVAAACGARSQSATQPVPTQPSTAQTRPAQSARAGTPQPQPPQQPPPAWLREATRLDLDGHNAEARLVIQAAMDSMVDPRFMAQANRALAMSFAFEGDCAHTVQHEQLVIDYWKTREQAEPQNAFYQQGEMANEAARVCLDAGKADEAERLYGLGSELGQKEPEPATHPRSLWDYRLAHALGRIAARRGNAAEAARQVAAARRALDSDSTMARQQERFYPYLLGYVELYAGDAAQAQAELTRAVSLPGNDRDPFMHALLGMAYEKLGRQAEARAEYRKAFELATAHNPPAAFARRFVREKLGPEVSQPGR